MNGKMSCFRGYVFSLAVLAGPLAAPCAAQPGRPAGTPMQGRRDSYGAATESRAGDFIFKMPAGWQRADRGDKTFIGPNLAATTNSTYLQLQAFDLGNNSLQAGFDAGWSGFQKKQGFRSAGPIKSEHSPNGFDYLYAAGAFQDGGRQWMVIFMAAQYGRRIETVVFLTNEIQAFNQTYQKDVASLLASVRFSAATANAVSGANAGSSGGVQPPLGVSPEGAGRTSPSLERNPALPPRGPMSPNEFPTVPGKFSGIFRAEAPEGRDTISMLELFDPARRTPNYQFLVLFSDGSAMRGLPDMGLDNFVGTVRLDIAGGGKSAYKWGVYQMAGTQGRVVFANPQIAGQQLVSKRLAGDSWPIQEYPDHLDINGSSYVLLDGGVSGMKLEGTYKPYGDKSQPGITFTRDGEFIDEGIMKAGATAVGVVGGGFAIGYAFSSPGPGRGAYYISNYTLHLNYSNSQSPPVLFWLGSETSRGVIYINNVKFQLLQ